MKNLKILFLFWLTFGLFMSQGLAQTYTLQPDFIKTDGEINAITEYNGRLYIGGNFNYVGYATGPGAVLNLTSGEPDFPFAQVSGGEINVVVPDERGGWFIGGSFNRVGGQPRRAIARIKPDKTLDENWECITDPVAVVNAIAVDGDNVFVGGSFTQMGGVARLNLAMVNNVNGQARPFNPAPDGAVQVMRIHNNTIYVGGDFVSMFGFARQRTAAFDLTTLQPTNWSPPCNGTVRTIFVHAPSNALFLGGDFTRCNGVTRNRIVKVDFNNNLYTWNPTADASVRAIQGVSTGENEFRLYVGGDFNYIGGRFRDRLAEFVNPETDQDTFATNTWTTGTDDAVNSLLVQDGILYVAGNFTQINAPGGTLIRNFIAQLEVGTGAVSSWDPNSNNSINAMAVWGDRLYVGGAFSSIGRKRRSNVCSVEQLTGFITGWSPQVNGQVRTMAVENNTVYLGGDFTAIGPDNRRFIGAVSVNGNNALTWNPNPNARVHAIHIKNNILYAGGEFTRIGAADRRYLAALNLNTAFALNNFLPEPDGKVFVLTSDNTRLFAGGEFTIIGQNLEQKYLGAVFLTDGRADASWNTNTDEPVRALAVDQTRGRLYVGGGFQSLQTINSEVFRQSYLAALTLTDGRFIPTWDPAPNNDVLSIWVPTPSSKYIVIGGRFTNITNGGRVAQIDADSAVSSGWQPNINDGEVRSVLGVGRNLYVGGAFDKIINIDFGQRARSIAKYTSCGATVRLETTSTEVCPGQSVRITSYPTGFGQFFYRWTPSEGLSSSLSKEVTASPFRTTTYTLQVTDGENCVATEKITITVQPLPQADAGPGITTCRGNNPQPQLNATGGFRYIWTPGRYLNDSTLANPIVQNLPQTTTFTLTAFSGSGCIDFDVVTVTVIDPPVVSLPDSQFICIGRNDSLQLNPNISFTGGQFEWQPETGLSNPRIRNPKVLPTNSTTYTLTYTSNESCVATGTVRVQLVGETGVNCGVDREICKGDTVVMDLITNAEAFIWNPPVYMDNFQTMNPKLFPPITTTYTVTAIGKGCVAYDTVTITVKQGASLDAGLDQLLCRGQVVQLNARGDGTDYRWSPSEGLSADDIPDPIATPTQTTIYTVTALGADGCRSSDVLTVFVREAPTLVVRDQIVYSCSGDSAIMAVSGAFTYSWLPNDGITQPNSTVPKAAPAQTTTYTVTGRDQFGCEATAEVVVVVAQKPIADAGPDLTVCRGNSITLSGSGGLTYFWEASTGENIDRTSQNPIVTPFITTDYMLTVFNEEGCFSKDVVRVTVLNAPLADAGKDTFMCPNFDNFVQLNAVGGVGYSWSPSEGLSNTSIPNPIARPTRTTTYTVQVTGGNGCVRADSITITVLPEPIAEAGPDVLACPNKPVLLQASGGVSYSWTPAEFLDDPFSATPRATVSRRTVFTVTVTNELGCMAQDLMVVSIDSVFKLSVDATPAPVVCRGSSVILEATMGAISYRWQPTRGLNNPLISAPTASPDTTTTYTVTAMGANGCIATAEVRVVVNELPLNATAGNDTFACKGGSVQLMARGGFSYNWSPADGLSNPNIPNPISTPLQNMRYFVTITGQNGCTIVDTINVSVFEIPQVIITPSNDPLTIFCDQEGTLLTTISRPGYRYQWKDSGNNIPGANAASFTATRGGLYSVEVTANGCTRSSDTRRVVVQPKPNAQAGNDVSICRGGNGTQLNATGGNEYAWTPSQGLSDVNIANPTANPERTTTYTVRVTDTATGCFSTDEVKVTVNEPITLTISANGRTTFCEGESVELISTTAPGYSYQWKRNGQNLEDGKASRYVTSQSGSYTVEVSVAGCPTQVSTPIVVTVVARPEVDAGKNVLICRNGRAVLKATGAARYQWMPNVNLTNPTDSVVVARPTQTTVYTVIGYGEGGCIDMDTVVVDVLPTESLPPAVITPLGDIKVCPGSPIELRANINLPEMNVRYQWYYNERRIQGATAQTYTATQEGAYQVELIADVCSSSLSDAKAVIYRQLPQVFLNRRNVSCDECRDGEIKVTVIGGTPPYSLSKNDDPFVPNVNLFSNLPKGRYKITVRDSAGCVVSDSVRIESPTAMNDLEILQSVQVYPNPSQGVFTLQAGLSRSELVVIQVFDLAGKEVWSKSISSGERHIHTAIELNEQASGVYLLKLTTGQSVVTQKIIKE